MTTIIEKNWYILDGTNPHDTLQAPDSIELVVEDEDGNEISREPFSGNELDYKISEVHSLKMREHRGGYSFEDRLIVAC